MRPDELLDLLRKRPFVPLRIYTTKGKAYELQHPDGIIVYKSCFDIGVGPDPKRGLSHRSHRVSLLHIVKVERIDGAVEQTDDEE